MLKDGRTNRRTDVRTAGAMDGKADAYVAPCYKQVRQKCMLWELIRSSSVLLRRLKKYLMIILG